MYDVTRRETFTNLSDIWAKEIDLYSTNQDCIKMLVGNKVDKVFLKIHNLANSVQTCDLFFFPSTQLYCSDLVFGPHSSLCSYCTIADLRSHFGRKVRGLSQKRRELNLLENMDVYF